jgi:hypothetical protein
VFVDAEVAELLRESPDLLAIADAVGATQSRQRRRSWTAGMRVVAAAAAVTVAAALALVSPWEGRGGGFVAQALAALGNGQVIHVVSVADTPGRTVLDLETGAETPIQVRTEIWFDEARGLRRTLVRSGGQLTTDELQTPEGAWTPGGRVYTCAWIAAHPVEATRARVSCNASGLNGTVPRQVAEPRPTLEPSLAGFVTGYRDALANGSAHRDGTGVIDGRPVTWLRFANPARPGQAEPAPTPVQRVAVDSETLRPVVVETLLDGRRVYRRAILSIGTLEAKAVDFSRPKPTPPGEWPIATRGQDRPLAIGDAAGVLEGRLLWAGATLEGLQLREMTRREITTSYEADSGVAPTHSIGVEIYYGADERTLDDYVVLRQSLVPEMLYGFVGPYAEPPAEGSMLVSPIQWLTTPERGTRARPEATVWRGQLVKSGVYVTIDARTRSLLVEAARALTREGLE